MDEQFDIEVSDVTRQEFAQAGRELVRTMAAPLLVAVSIVTIAVMMFLGDYSLKSLLPPFVILAVLLAAAWFLVALGYKDFPKDTRFSYLIDSDGWEITVGGRRANIDWQDTARMVVRSRIILLYNEDNRSNMLPRRCVSDQQLAMMQTWFQASRPTYKARRQAKERQLREEHRQNRQNARRGRWF